MSVTFLEALALLKTADVHPEVQARFEELKGILNQHGVLAGTGHKRIVIPKDKLTEDDVHGLGFTPVTVAIPEAGQDRFSSFRHPDTNYHIHSHPEGWTLHEDAHAAATMLAKKEKTFGGKARAMAAGIPHVNEEGLPGLYYYAKGRLSGHKSTAQHVLGEMSPESKALLQGLSSSPTYAAPPPVVETAKTAEEKTALIERLKTADVHPAGEPNLTSPVLTPAEAAGKLQIGDIFLAHRRNQGKLPIGNWIIEKAQGTPYAHAAIYDGKKNVLHTYAGKGANRLSLEEFNNIYDYKVYRPQASLEQKKDAVNFAHKVVKDGRGYSFRDNILGWLPPHTKNVDEDTRRKDRDAATMNCGGLVASSYAGIPWAEGKRPTHVIPVEFAKSPFANHVGTVLAPDSKFRTAEHMKIAEEKKFKLQGHLEHQGLGIAVENRKGSVRKGVDKDGKPWRTEMKMPYGYIKGTKGADGEEVDAYVGPKKDATHAFVVHQRKDNGKGYDEDKVMLGQPSLAAAKKAYLAHYNDPKFLGPVSTVPMEHLKELLRARHGEKLTLKKEAVSEEYIRRVLERTAPHVSANRLTAFHSNLGEHQGSLLRRADANLEVAKNLRALRPAKGSPAHVAMWAAADTKKWLNSKANMLDTISRTVDDFDAMKRIHQADPKGFADYAWLNPGLGKDASSKEEVSSARMESFFDELQKLGAVGDEELERTKARYKELQEQRPDAAQVGRYMGFGAVTAPVLSAMGNAIRGGRMEGQSMASHLTGARDVPFGVARSIASDAARGALASGAIPVLRGEMDRRVEMRELAHKMKEHEGTAGRLEAPFTPIPESSGGVSKLAKRKKEKDSASFENTPAQAWSGHGIVEASFEGEKAAFATSEYSSNIGRPSAPQVSQLPPFRVPALRGPQLQKEGAGAPTRGGFLMASELPPFRVQPLGTRSLEKKGGLASTPAGRLSASKGVGAPSAAPSGPGPNTAAQAGHVGTPMPGSIKGGIGKRVPKFTPTMSAVPTQQTV